MSPAEPAPRPCLATCAALATNLSRRGLDGFGVRLPGALAAVALAALLVLPSALAQAPSPAPSVSIEIAEPEGTVTVEQARTFKATVRNNGQSTPLDAQNMGDVNIILGGVPEGWTASANPANFELAPGASREVDIQVSVAAGASAKAADITVTAEMFSPLRGLDPILGNIPGATQRSTDNASLALTVEESFTRDVLEALGPWIYAVLLLLVAAVVVAVGLTVAARRTLVRLASDTRELAVAPGGKVAFAFRAEGLARDPDTVLLQVSAVQEGWAAFLPVPELTLEPGQAQDLQLIVIAPRDALQGTRQGVLVTATSAKAPKGAATLEFVAVVEGLAETPATPSPRRRKE